MIAEGRCYQSEILLTIIICKTYEFEAKGFKDILVWSSHLTQWPTCLKQFGSSMT